MNSKSLKKIITQFFCYFIFINIAVASQLQDERVISWINDTGRKLIDVLSNPDIEEKYTKLETIFNEDIDTEYMARFVIGKYWKMMNEEQQQRYLGLFNRYAISLYKNYPLNFDTKGLDFNIISITHSKKFTDAVCSITLPEQFAT